MKVYTLERIDMDGNLLADSCVRVYTSYELAKESMVSMYKTLINAGDIHYYNPPKDSNRCAVCYTYGKFVTIKIKETTVEEV